VWIQSIHGRRAVESIGPVPPRISTGARSHQAQKIVAVACISPTVLWTAAAIARPAYLA